MKLVKALILILALLFFASEGMAALTVTISRSAKADKESVRDISLAFDASYATGGLSLTAANLSLAGVNYIICQPTSGYIFEYDYTNSKLKAFYSNDTNTANGPQIEVPNATNLSTLTGVRCRVYGY